MKFNIPFLHAFQISIVDKKTSWTGFSQSTNGLPVPLSAWSVGTFSPFAYAQYLKGGASNHEPKNKTRTTGENGYDGIKRGENPAVQ